MKKIIILYSTAGMGHKKAAIALFKAFREKGGNADVEIIDILEYGNRSYKFIYFDLYVFFMSRARWLWGVLYDLSNTRVVDLLTRRMRGVMDSRSLPGLVGMLTDKKADAIVSTHFLLPSIAGVLKQNRDFRSRTYAVVTDYGPHSYWLSDHIDRFFVGSGSAKQELAKRDVPEEKIDVTGIPTTDEFRGDFDTGMLRGIYGLDAAKKTVFMMSGGFGVGPMEEMLVSLNSCRADIQVITVCGHNKRAYKRVEALREKLEYPVVLFGFTDKIAELMAVSDLMITKAGGISVTEAMNSRLPMILFASVPGQETWNEEFLVKSRAAEKAEKVKDIPVIADRMLLTEGVYDTYKSAIDRIRRPDAAERVVDIVLEAI
ncbi:MAG: glycosyltransferase [Candidatus Omnitrophota bacterium]|nr:glycosyltransferase [Candidatus Omnitrophota bacterium]